MKRTQNLNVRITRDEQRAIHAEALRLQITVTDLIRQELQPLLTRLAQPPAPPLRLTG